MDRGVSLFVQCDVSQYETGECIRYGVFLLECIMAASAGSKQRVSQARAGLKLRVFCQWICEVGGKLLLRMSLFGKSAGAGAGAGAELQEVEESICTLIGAAERRPVGLSGVIIDTVSGAAARIIETGI
jgi:hypothetical protein